MRAVVVEGPGQITVTTVPDPTPGPNDVVVAVDACGLCGTDLHLVDGEIPVVNYPITPGHELAGRVVAVGSEVTRLAEGDAVAVDPSLPCGECRYCRKGKGNLCEPWQAIGISSPGGAAEYVQVQAKKCYPLPEGISPTAAALIEPLSCAVHGLDKAPHDLTDDVLIYGAGTMGLLLAQLLKRAGVRSLSVVDRRQDRLAVAESMGVSAIATDASALDEAAEGWDLVVDATGVIAAIEDGLGRVRKAGTFLQFGVADAAKTANFSPFKVYNEEITIVGSMAVHNSFDRARDLLVAGAIDSDALITNTAGLDDYAAALEEFRTGTGLKTLVLPSQ
ncbi:MULTISPECIES: zinc-dependent alcohol dehydrogenase family protein [Saccharopolyspora]|nr:MULTISPECIES: zinc-dependent alcohol dehydrogenase family protein [Saccharopolyspora]MCA1187397.1 zinc-dependent alcohol dehydrogenase family protein [Saccharopolyspora sp. 6T]MCA1192470.1 zinc-dependent alcohol dehydrogenase family protein [Saccharopolyspora sp. 6V]MCA1224490.1 zinc-dependent alcohol dehydrogenase family protein [Saccharopolyspora sp. 6M]MCA1282266.1 zinc-dependent alcohol dehydrogenase family protein [Saccharopolyspora sp. 7B]